MLKRRLHGVFTYIYVFFKTKYCCYINLKPNILWAMITIRQIQEKRKSIISPGFSFVYSVKNSRDFSSRILFICILPLVDDLLFLVSYFLILYLIYYFLFPAARKHHNLAFGLFAVMKQTCPNRNAKHSKLILTNPFQKSAFRAGISVIP